MPTPATQPIPEGMHTLTPHLVCDGAADAIAFYIKAFGAIELMRLPGPDNKLMHAALRIGDSVLMLADNFPQWNETRAKSTKSPPVVLHMYVKDVDAVFAQAVAAGATVVMPVTDMF